MLFLRDYISKKSEVYKSRTRPNLQKGWDFGKMRDQAQKVRTQIQLMQDDLPALKLASGEFFENLMKAE